MAEDVKNLEAVRARELEYIRGRRQGSRQGDADSVDSLIGLALSGGGVRSAATCLGVLQAMSRMGILRLVDYLSTVSGGGYIAGCMSWLLSINNSASTPTASQFVYGSRTDLRFDTTWAHFPLNPESVVDGSPASASPTLGRQLIDHLRTNGVTRGNPFRRQALRAFGTLFGGIASTLALTFSYLFVTTILLLGAAHALAPGIANWKHVDTRVAGNVQIPTKANQAQSQASEGSLVLATLTRIVWDMSLGIRSEQSGRALGAGAATTAIIFTIVVVALKQWRGPEQWAPGESREDALERRILRSAGMLLLLGAFIVPFVNVSVAPSHVDPSWLLQPLWFTLAACITALLMHVLVLALFGASGLLWSRATRSLWAAYMAISCYATVATLLFAVFPAVCYAVSQVGTVSLLPPLVSWLTGGLLSTDAVMAFAERFAVTRTVLPVLRRIVVAALIGFTMVAIATVAIDNEVFASRDRFIWALVTSGEVFLVLSIFLNLNRIGLHVFYRDRVLETYLRVEHTGLDGRRHTVLDASEMRLKDLHGHRVDREGAVNSAPYLLINAALNLTGSRDVNRRDRKWSHFLFSKFFCGSQQTGYLETVRYAGGTTPLARALTISGVSGASDGAVQRFFAPWFLNALLNTSNTSRNAAQNESVSTGQWIANPRFNSGQRLAFWPLYVWREALGFATEHTRLVHVSHAGRTGDDIGIYALFQRRCQIIIACDCEADGAMAFQSFARVLRDANVDLGVEVDIDLSMIAPDGATGLSRSHCAIGRVRYPECPARPNWLVYMKNSLTGNEATPLVSYKRAAPDFPHEETAAQFIDDDQFESYRALGEHIAEETFARWILDSNVRRVLGLPFVMSPASEARNHLGPISADIVWDELRIHHSPFRAAGNETFLQLLKEVGEIGTLISSSPSLQWYYPEYMGFPTNQHHDEDRGDPVHVVAMQASLMESAYFSLRLDQYANARDNRGLMNTFRRWGRSETFKTHFAQLRSNHSSEFVAFFHYYIEDWEDVDRYPVPHAWDVGLGTEERTSHPSALKCRLRGAPGLFQDPGRFEVREPAQRPAPQPLPHPLPDQQGSFSSDTARRPTAEQADV